MGVHEVRCSFVVSHAIRILTLVGYDFMETTIFILASFVNQYIPRFSHMIKNYILWTLSPNAEATCIWLGSTKRKEASVVLYTVPNIL